MSITKPGIFNNESRTWSRALDYFKEENSQLKISLSIFTDSKNDHESIELAEFFQSRFLRQDKSILKLNNLISKQNESIQFNYNNPHVPDEMKHMQDDIRKEINFLETDFSNMKKEYHYAIAEMF